MKTKSLLAGLALGLGLLAHSLLFAQGGPANRGANANPAPTPNPDCPNLVDGACPNAGVCPNGFTPGEGRGCWQGQGECPNLVDGACPQAANCGQGVCQSPTGERKLDGTGGPGKPANPAGPQDGSGATKQNGRGYRGGRG